MNVTTRTIRATILAFAGVLAVTSCSTALNVTGVDATASTLAEGRTEVASVGFISAAQDSPWQAASVTSIRDSLSRDSGFELTYLPVAESDKKGQIDAFSTLVSDGVDAIVLSVSDGTGWTEALTAAHEANIPVVLVGGAIDPDNTSLYVTRIVADDQGAAKQAADWAVAAFPDGAKYFVLEGPSGVDEVTLRTQGWDGVMSGLPAFESVGTQSANWSADQAKDATVAMLAANENAVPLIFAESDEMALGAALGVEAAGLTPGTNVKIVTIGGAKDAMQALLDGRLSFVAERNPILGPTVAEVLNTVLGGSTVDPIVAVPSHGYATITQEELDARTF